MIYIYDNDDGIKILIEEDDIRKNPNNYSWNSICYRNKLSEDFIMEFSTYVNWEYVSDGMNDLSENFIRKFQNFVYWNDISRYQNLSKEFIIEFSDKVNFNNLLKNNEITSEVKEFCRMFI